MTEEELKHVPGSPFYMERNHKLSSMEENMCTKSINAKDGKPIYMENIDYKIGSGMGFKFNSDHLYGIPERKTDFKLKDTLGYTGAKSEPYRFFNRDKFRPTPSLENLYASMPYLTSHTKDYDASMIWLNAAESYADLYSSEVDVGSLSSLPSHTRNGQEGNVYVDTKRHPVTYANFISESGMIDVFIFAAATDQSTKGPQAVVKKNAQITGFAPMPPYYSLGFHFSKWDSTSALAIIKRDNDFLKYKVPVDVIWMDIGHTWEKQYFSFDRGNFP
jgi:mannosyl-oligosaccharide alpha-1,3-glucosidase